MSVNDQALKARLFRAEQNARGGITHCECDDCRAIREMLSGLSVGIPIGACFGIAALALLALWQWLS